MARNSLFWTAYFIDKLLILNELSEFHFCWHVACDKEIENKTNNEPIYRNMKLMNYHPMQSPFESLFRDTWEVFAPLFENNEGERSGLSMEWFKDDTHYYARIDLPGFSREDLTLEYEPDTVTLSIRKESESGEETKFQRQIRVPDDVDGSGVNAELKDGVLTLTLPKTPEKEPVTIEIA